MLGRRSFLEAAAAALITPAIAKALPERAATGVHRRYLDGRFGQIHIRVAVPRGRPQRDTPPLLMLHQTPLSGRMFDRMLAPLSRDRIVIAVDTPGYGESDRPSVRPALAEYSTAIMGAVGQAYGRTFDVLGYHTGAMIAIDAAAREASRVRKLVLVSVPYFDATRRATLVGGSSDEPAYLPGGEHLLPLWAGSYKVKPPGQSLDDVARIVAEKQRGGRFGDWAIRSALAEDVMRLLARIGQPTCVLTPHDGLQEPSRAAAARIANARIVDLPNHAYGLFDAAPAELARIVLDFLG